MTPARGLKTTECAPPLSCSTNGSESLRTTSLDISMALPGAVLKMAANWSLAQRSQDGRRRKNVLEARLETTHGAGNHFGRITVLQPVEIANYDQQHGKGLVLTDEFFHAARSFADGFPRTGQAPGNGGPPGPLGAEGESRPSAVRSPVDWTIASARRLAAILAVARGWRRESPGCRRWRRSD